MNKKYLKFFSILMFIAVFFTINGCNGDDNSSDGNNGTEVTLPKEAYRLQIVEAKFSQPLSQEEYDGTLGNVSLKLVRADEHTLLFHIPETVALGETAFSIPQLNVSQQLEVKNAELQGNEAVVLASLLEKTTADYQQISDPEYTDYLTGVHTAFKDYYQTLSMEEKNQMALLYQINKPFFDDLLNPNSVSAKGVGETEKLVAKFSILTTIFVSGSIALSFPGTPVEKAVIAVVAVTSAVKALETGKELVDRIDIIRKIKTNLLGGKSAENALKNKELTFVHNQPQNVPFYTESEGMTNANRSGTADALVTFFNAYDSLISATGKVNNVIRFINDHVFFANISEIPVYRIPGNSETETTAIDEELFSYLSFSVADSNVNLTETSFENGTVRMKMTIANPNAVTGDGVSTQLNYTYEDAFNNVSGSIPVVVKLEEEVQFELMGIWQIKYYDNSNQYIQAIDLINFQNGANDLGLDIKTTFFDENGAVIDEQTYGRTWRQSFDSQNSELHLRLTNDFYIFSYDSQTPNYLQGYWTNNPNRNMELVKQ